MARRRVEYDEVRPVIEPETHVTVEKNIDRPKAKTLEAKESIATVSAAGKNKIRLTVQEGIDILAAYQISDRAFVEFAPESGKCLFCGKKTNSPTRIVCNDCDKKYVKRIYERLSKAVAEGDDSFVITY